MDIWHAQDQRTPEVWNFTDMPANQRSTLIIAWQSASANGYMPQAVQYTPWDITKGLFLIGVRFDWLFVQSTLALRSMLLVVGCLWNGVFGVLGVFWVFGF